MHNDLSKAPLKFQNFNKEILAMIDESVASGKPVTAINLIKEALGCGLAEAKNEYELYVEALYQKTNPKA